MQNMKMQDEQRLFVATASASVMAGLVTKVGFTRLLAL
jgi:hypothetical protein